MNNKPIGILDSGVGGLSVYREVDALLPQESTLYIGDNAFAPYGRLPKEEIYNRSKKLVSFLVSKDVKLVVVACNTITVSSIDQLRNDFPHVPIIGTVPVIKTAGVVTKNGRIGILSTTRTNASSYQKELIKKFADGHSVFTHGTDKLVPLIEKGEVDGEAMQVVLREVLADFQKEEIDTLVLGSTHFPFVKDAIHNVLGNGVQLLESGDAIARQVKRILGHNDTLADHNDPSKEFYTTGDTQQVDQFAKKLLGAKIATTRVTL